MFSEMARMMISSYLSKYFLNLNKDTLSLSFWTGYLNCENLKLNPQKFNENKNFPIHLQDGVISKINMSLPIKSFLIGINNEIEISIEDIDINLITNSGFEFFDYTNFDYKSLYIKEITDDLLLKMELSKNPNFNDTYKRRSIDYIMRNMKITVKNIHLTLIHRINELYNNIFCINIDKINLKKDSFILDNFYIYTENIISSSHNLRKKDQDYILSPMSIKSKISMIKKSENEINNKENIKTNTILNTNNNNSEVNNNNINNEEIETYFVDFNISEININIHKEQFISIMNVLNFFMDYKKFYNNCFILRKIQYNKPNKEEYSLINENINNNNDNDNENNKNEINNNNENNDKKNNYYLDLFRHYIKGMIFIFKEQRYNIDVFDYNKDLNTTRKKIFQSKFNEFNFKNKNDDEMINIIRFTDEDVLKKWIEEMCDSIYKYQKEGAQGIFSGIKSYFFSSESEGIEMSNIEEVSSKQKIIWEFKGNINIITLSLKNYNEEIKLSILENEVDFYRGRINNNIEMWVGNIKLSFKHLINKSNFGKEIILPLSNNFNNSINDINDNNNKEIYIKYIFKKFIPKLSTEKSYLDINCSSHVLIYNPSMFHCLYQFLYKDVNIMKKNFTQDKLFSRISSHKFDKENKVNLDINIANHKIVLPYLNSDIFNYNNEEKLEINLGDLDIKCSEQYDILVENISVDFKDKNLITNPIIKNFSFTLKSSFDLNTNVLKLKNIEIQASLHFLQTLLYNSKNFSALTKPEEIWKIKTKNKSHIFDNSKKRGFLFYKTGENKWIRFYSLLSGGYIYLFEKSGNPNADYLIPLYDSYIEDVYYNNVDNFIYGFNIVFGDNNLNEVNTKKIYEISFNDKKLMNEWKNSINNRIEEINQSLIDMRIKKKRKLSGPNNNIINTNINLNDKKEVNNNILNSGNNNYSNLIFEESIRIRNNIKNKFENNKEKKLRTFSDQIIKFLNSYKGNRHCSIEIENISLLLNYSNNEKNINNKGCKIILINTKIEYIENSIFFVIRSYSDNIQVISNNLNLIKVYDKIDENQEINCFINCNILICYDSAYDILDKNRNQLIKLVPNINKKEEIEDFILKIKTNQIKINLFKEFDIFFEPEEIFININLIKNFFKKIKKKVNETIQIKNKINLIVNSEKNISLIYNDEYNKSNYYLILKEIKSKENSTIFKNVHLIYIEKENKRNKNQNKKTIINEFDVIIKDSFKNNIIMYDVEFSSDIYCYLNKIDFDNLYNIINDIRYSLKNNFQNNINQNQISNNVVAKNNFQKLYKIKIQKIECNFIISSIFRLKNDNEIKLTLSNICINKEKANNYTLIVQDIALVRYIKTNNISNQHNKKDNDGEILFKIPKSNNAIYLQYENIKNEKTKLLDFVIDRIILNLQYELLYDFLNFFINVKCNHLNYQNNNKEPINNNIEINSNIPNNNNSSFSNNTIISLNNFNKENNNNSSNKNSNNNEILENSINIEKKNDNHSEINSDFLSFQVVPLLIINLNINSLLLKIPIKQQKNNINLITDDMNDKNNNKTTSFEKQEEEDLINENNKIQYFCIELISLLIRFRTDLTGYDKSLPCYKYIRIQSPENRIYIISKKNKNRNRINNEKITHLLNNSFSFFTEIKYNYKIHKELFVPQKKYSFYYILPDDIILNLSFDHVKTLMDIIIDIKNYYHESKLTYFTYCYLSEPEIYTTIKTLFFEICGHIHQKIIIRIEEFFEIIVKKVHFSYKDLSTEKYNQEINLIFTLIINYYNKKLKEYELFLEPYNFKFTALNNSFKFCSNDKLIIYQNKNNEIIENKDNINLDEIKKTVDNNQNDNNSSDKLSTNNSDDISNNENVIIKDNNPNGLSFNITVELLYIINNLYDIFMLYKKCHVLQNIQAQNNVNSNKNNKSLIIYFYNYTDESIKINKKYEIKSGEVLKYRIKSDKEQLYEINFTQSNIQYNEIKLNELQNILIYNKIYFYNDNNKYYFYYPIICQSFCQKEIYITNFLNDDNKNILLNTNMIQGININNFKNKTIFFKLNENMIISLGEKLIESVKKYLKDNENENINKNKLIIKDYFILKFERISKDNKNLIKIGIYPRYLILNTLNIPIILYSILNECPDSNNKIQETELLPDGKITDLYYPFLPQLKFKLKIIHNEAKNGNIEFLSDIAVLNNEYLDEHLLIYNKNEINNINTSENKNDKNNNKKKNEKNNNINYYDNKKIISINGKLKIKFKDSDDIIIKVIYHTIPETKQLKIYLYMDYFILNNTKLSIYPLNNCLFFKDNNFIVNYYPIKNFKNFQLVVADKIIEKFEIRKEDYAFFIHIEVEVLKDKKINLLIQRHLRYFKLGEKLYKIDFLIISQIQKLNINNSNNINNIIVNSSNKRVNKIKNISKVSNDNNKIYSDDDILMKLVKQRNIIDLPEVSNVNHKFSFQLNFPSIYITLITNNNIKDNEDNININNQKIRNEIASLYLDNIDFNFIQEKINFKANIDTENKQTENDNDSNLFDNNNNINNINNINSKNKNFNIDSNNDIDINNYAPNNYLEEIEDTYNNNIELTIQSIQIDNLLENCIYKVIFYNKEYKKSNDSSYNYKSSNSSWLIDKRNSLPKSKNDSNNTSNNNLLPFIHFKGSFINQDYKYYFNEINICFLPCYLYLDSEFGSELLLFIIESYNIFKNKIFYYSISIKEIIDSLSFNLDSNFNSKFFIFISSFKISPLTIIMNYRNASNRLFNLLNLQNNFINTLLDVFTNNTTSIKFQFNSIVLYAINVRFMALIYKLYDYYYYTFLRECIKIFFSVDILGDPYHLISHLSQGISNFITLPILNIFKGPSEFIFYLLYGTKSLLSNSIGGLLDSLYKFTNSMSKNILKLTNSEEYIKSRNKIFRNENYIDVNLINYVENNRKRKNYNNINGFNLLLILKILQNGVKYGVKDLFVMPYKYYKNNGIIEIPIGAIYGSLSLVIKPVSALMDSISILSNCISHEVLKGEENFDIDEDYMYYILERKRQRREWVYNLDNKEKIRRYKELNIDVLLNLIGDGLNIDNEIERGIYNEYYHIDKIFITKYTIQEKSITKKISNDILYNNEKENTDIITLNKNNINNKENINNNIIATFTIIAFIRNKENNEYSIMIYIVNINKIKNERTFDLFTNKENNDKNYIISKKLQDIIPCKDIVSINVEEGKNNIIICYQKERDKKSISKVKMMSLLKHNYFSSFYGFLYLKKTYITININFSSKYILKEFRDYFKNLKYNNQKKNK